MHINKQTTTVYGIITNEECPYCKKCNEYTLKKHTTWKKFLFFSLYPRNKEYIKRCTNCGSEYQLSGLKAKRIIDGDFRSIERKAAAKVIFINVFWLIVIAAVAFVVVAIVMNTNSVKYKNLVTDKAPGYYEIYNKDGEFCAAITKDETSAIYDKFITREEIRADEYDDVNADFVLEEYYTELEGELVYIEGDAGAMIDDFGLCVRYYYYDIEEDDIFYYYGVDDLTSLWYGGNRVYYNMTHYVSEDEKEYYLNIYQKTDEHEIITVFFDSLLSVQIYTLDNGRVTKYDYYDIEYTQDFEEVFQDVDKNTLGEQILSTVAGSNLQPCYSETLSYYENTNIVESYIATNTYTGLTTRENLVFSVEEKYGYYIVKPLKNLKDNAS